MNVKTLSLALVLGTLAITSDRCPAACDIPHDPWEEVDASGFTPDDYIFTLFDWNRHYTIVQTPQTLTITLSMYGEKDRTHTAPGVDARLSDMVRRILESGHCPTPIEHRAEWECEGAGCEWGTYKWYVWFPEEEEHTLNAFNELNEYIFTITSEWNDLPAFFGYSITPPEHVQAQGIFPTQLILRSGAYVRLYDLRVRLEKAGYTVRELKQEEMGPVVSLDGSEVHALGIEKGGRECHIYYFTNPGDTRYRLGPFWDSSKGPARADRRCNKLVLPL